MLFLLVLFFLYFLTPRFRFVSLGGDIIRNTPLLHFNEAWKENKHDELPVSSDSMQRVQLCSKQIRKLISNLFLF